jgi:endonuclease YncB( thermonuclease family)
MARRIAITFTSATIILFLVAAAYSETVITGKVVGVSDGDTITVLQDRAQYKIRLYGIDCPEFHQDFGTRAKQFTSDLVFRKVVRVVQKDMDRYGRVVGLVYAGDLCLNEEIVRSGFAWVYLRYCKEPVCQKWKDIENRARENRVGLWSHPDPIPPWNYRRGVREMTPKDTSSSQSGEKVYHGNTSSMVFHQPSCKYYNCKNCNAVFKTREEATKAGYRPCGLCKS